MDLFLSWLVIAVVQLAATMSPGPAFVVSVRYALSYGRKVGVFCAIGLGLGVLAHVAFVLCGISFIIAQSVILFSFIKYLGAAYLFYIGVKSILNARKKGMDESEVSDVAQAAIGGDHNKHFSLRKALVTGFLTNLLNPKAIIFFTAVFTQFIGVDTPLAILMLYGGTSFMIEVLWFIGVTVVLTHERVRSVFLSFMHWVERICGGLMLALGIKLVLSK